MSISPSSDHPPEGAITRQAMRTPRAAGVAGVVFAVLLITALVLVRVAVPRNESGAEVWLSDSARRNSVLFALSLIPFAAIAFLWFIGVVRDRIGESEDRFFATVFLGSGLLFVAMLFVSAATTAGIIAGAGNGHSGTESQELWRFGRQVTNTVLNVYAMRMASVFMISTSTLLFRTGVLPRWTALSGYGIALILLFSVGLIQWVELLFPLWVLLLSVTVLIDTYRTGQPAAAGVARTRA